MLIGIQIFEVYRFFSTSQAGITVRALALMQDSKIRIKERNANLECETSKRTL